MQRAMPTILTKYCRYFKLILIEIPLNKKYSLLIVAQLKIDEIVRKKLLENKENINK